MQQLGIVALRKSAFPNRIVTELWAVLPKIRNYDQSRIYLPYRIYGSPCISGCSIHCHTRYLKQTKKAAIQNYCGIDTYSVVGVCEPSFAGRGVYGRRFTAADTTVAYTAGICIYDVLFSQPGN